MRVLVIEDEPDLLQAVMGSLREAGMAVDGAADGKSGLSKARITEYDAVVLDLMLPELNGMDVLRQLRRHRDTPVLILTARDGLDDRIAGLDGGADDYLTKPFELPELIARLRALARRAAGRPSPVIHIGDIHLNTVRRTVDLRGQDIPLTPTEYSLLELLATNADGLVSRTQIYEHLFDETDDRLSNVVDVHIANLRRKLGRDVIKTRRGEGYMIHA
ncbi:MAG TPA: response regulator transcription factor [Phycisphaerae bacterium]|nr:response regulator transcription factor [Phycisphaerae bacterium]HRW51841.1 response regulator transcription factor [Phycisphaerae bacterium]